MSEGKVFLLIDGMKDSGKGRFMITVPNISKPGRRPVEDSDPEFIVNYEGKSVPIEILSTTGVETFSATVELYYHNFHIGVLVYSVTNSTSFEILPTLIHKINSMRGEHKPLLIFGDTTDEEQGESRVITEAQGKEFANKHKFLFMEGGAGNRLHVEAAIMSLLPLTNADPQEKKRSRDCLVM